MPNLALVRNLEPAAIRPLPERVYILYRRISKKGQESKAASFPKQTELTLAKLREIEPDLDFATFFEVFSDDHTGRDFIDELNPTKSRLGFARMYRWCQLHPRDPRKPGYIFLWELSRFGRPVLESAPGQKEEVDLDTFMYWYAAFGRLGW
ncbi:MAG: hypothetical protein ACJ78Q_01470, partial [Chloroflexia bacterium]